MKYLILFSLLFAGSVSLVVSLFYTFKADHMAEVKDKQQILGKYDCTVNEACSVPNNASQEPVATAVHKDELQRVDGSADKDFTKKPEPIVGGELKERRTDSELELAIISSEQENSVVDEEIYAASGVDEVEDEKQLSAKLGEDGSASNNASQEVVAAAVHKDELQRVDGSADKDFTKKPEPIVGGELKELRTDSESDLAMISSEQENSVVDEKIDAVVLKFDLKLSQTQQSFNKTLKKQQKLIDAMALQVKNIDDQQKRTVKSTSKLKKAYVEERVRREIADEVIKKHLTTD